MSFAQDGNKENLVGKQTHIHTNTNLLSSLSILFKAVYNSRSEPKTWNLVGEGTSLGTFWGTHWHRGTSSGVTSGIRFEGHTAGGLVMTSR